VRGLPHGKNHVVLFGHNPGFEMLANWLCGQRAISGLRTGGVIQLALQVDVWTLADAACASLISYTWPAQIGGGKDAYAQHA
jgi:phosphohistidine phosphatase